MRHLSTLLARAPRASAIAAAAAGDIRPTPRRRHLVGVVGVVSLIGAALLAPSGIAANPAPGATPVIVATPSTASPGTAIVVDGSGFDRNQQGSVSIDGATGPGIPFDATGHGTFSVTETLPTTIATRLHVIAAHAPDGTTLATTTIDVVDPVASSGAASATATPTPSPTAVPMPTPSASTAYTFDDEFDGSTLGAVWGTAGHWSNLSEATIDRSHTTVANGIMTISATRTAPNQWVSDTVDTFGRFTQTYGYFEARMRFSSGKGLWPAFWVAHDWTGDKSELDVNETLANPYTGLCGDNSGAYYATVHLSDGSTPQGSQRYCAGSDLAGAWHVYGMDWRADHISFYIDGQLWSTYTGTIPSTPLCIIFDLAVGGWAGASDSTTPSPSTLEVDWVRVRA